MKKIYSRDTTIEALAGVLVDNRIRFLIGRDELSGWLSSFNQYKSRGGSDQANWLELHSLGTLCVDRKTGEPKTIFVQGAGVSICGGIQPGVLKAALSDQHFSAGIPARLLFALPPRLPKEWTEDDIDEQAENAYHSLITKLTELMPNTDEDGNSTPISLSFSPEAKADWILYYARFAQRQADAEGDLAAAFSKLEGYAARLALVHHVTESVSQNEIGTEPVSVGSIRAGIALADWFTHEAERVYSMLGEDNEESETRKLVETVTRLGKRHGAVTARQLQRSNQRRYRSSAMAEAALDSLVSLKMGRWEEITPTTIGGQPTRRLVLCVTCDDTDTTSEPDIDNDDFEDETGGDDTGIPVTVPPGDGNGPVAGTALPHCGNEQSSCKVGEVVSVLSHVTHEPDTRECTGGSLAERELGDEGPVIHVEEESSRSWFTLVNTQEGVLQVAVAVETSVARVGVDTETTGLNPARDRVRLIQVASGNHVFVIDLFAFHDPAIDLVPLFAVLAGLEVVGHNLVGFDLPFLARLGFAPSRVFDLLLASRVVEGGADIGHTLTDMANRILGLSLDKSMQKADWSGPLSPAHLAYAATDVRYLVSLAERLIKVAANKKVSEILDLEMRCAIPVAALAARGVGIDTERWCRLARIAEIARVCARTELNELAGLPSGRTANWNSHADVKAAFASAGMELPNTTEETLASLDHPLASTLLAYRSAAKRVGTYGTSWIEKHVTDGRVHAAWKQCGACTGRMSCASPNLQQIPRGKAYRECFVAGAGRVLVKADYSQIELRIAAKVTGDKAMLAAYVAKADLHALTAARFLGIPVEGITKDSRERQIAKPVNFGAIYGLSPPSLRRKAKADYGKDMTEREARLFLGAFFDQFPGVRRWHRQLQVHSPAVVTTLAGRKLVMGPKAFHGTRANYIVQGTGGDGLKMALVLLHERRSECPTALPVLAVHDEIVVECPEGDAERVAGWLRRAMVDAMADLLAPVPVEVDVSVGATWAG